MNKEKVKEKLDQLVHKYKVVAFIEEDPIVIPKRFSLKEDQEIAGFFAAIFAWGQRKTIINKTNNLLSLMDNAPFDFIVNHQDQDLQKMAHFVHRTFNGTDLLYFIHRLKRMYIEDGGLEQVFSKNMSREDQTIEPALSSFYRHFFSDEFAPHRSKKHIASPDKKSTCKRLCMFLRWMVRHDAVDLGLWHSITQSQLMIPLDVHVARSANKYGLLHRKQKDWKAVCELTDNLRQLDANDPVKYDFALFGESIAN